MPRLRHLLAIAADHRIGEGAVLIISQPDQNSPLRNFLIAAYVDLDPEIPDGAFELGVS